MANPNMDDPAPGSMIGPFRIGERLGVGGMGVVFTALDTQLNRQVALKVITPYIADDPSFRARFTREAQTQASLDSPHVVQVYSFGEADGRLYIASQLIPDGDLGQMLAKHGRPPARIAVNLISQVADGLDTAHDAGLIHRDIKPPNVLLRNRDNTLTAYLGDFGIARQIEVSTALTQAGGTVGTPSYMAPELHVGGEAGVATDIYSMGCLLWAALSGSAPYQGSSEYQIVMAHLERPIPQLAPTGPLAHEINRVLRTAMAKQPGDRYASASAMRDDLKQVVRLPDDPTPVTPAGEGGTVLAPSGPPPSTGSFGTAAGPAWNAAPPRTPTPPPSLVQPTPAPPAPAFQAPPTPPPMFVHQNPTHPQGLPPATGPTASSGRRGMWVAIALASLVLVAGLAVLVALLLQDDEPTAPVSSGTSTPATNPTTSDPTSDPPTSDPPTAEPPTDPATVDPPTSGGDLSPREQQAADNLTAVFAAEPTFGESGGRCIAEAIVREVGVDRLVSSGVLDEDLNVVEDAQVTDDTLADPILNATFSCFAEIAGTG